MIFSACIALIFQTPAFSDLDMGGSGQPWPEKNLAPKGSLALKDFGLCSEVPTCPT